MMDLKSLDDLEDRIWQAIMDAVPEIKLPWVLLLNDISISIVETTQVGDKERTYIIGSVDADVSLHRRFK